MIIILTTIVAAAIPILAPAGSDREIREATRGLNTYITGAQTRATALRRPFGIALKRLSQDTNTDPNKSINPALDIHDDNGVCLEVYYVEQQPPYAGFDSNSRVCVSNVNSLGLSTIRFVTRGNANPPDVDWLPPGWDFDLFPGFTVRYGDVIEIGDTRFVFSAQDQPRAPQVANGFLPPYNNGPRALEIQAQPINDTGQLLSIEYDQRGRPLRDGPPLTGPKLQSPYYTAPMPYRILRQPTATSDPPYQLPEGTAIDLRASGIGRDRFFHYPSLIATEEVVDNSAPVVILFTPEGRVERVSYSLMPLGATPNNNTKFDESIVDNIYLLVGKRENIPVPLPENDQTLSASGMPATLTDQQKQELKEPINWLFGLSRWVVIGSQSGRVVSVENAAVDPLAVMSDLAPPFPAAQSSEAMRTRQILAAREFTFDMANMGGR